MSLTRLEEKIVQFSIQDQLTPASYAAQLMKETGDLNDLLKSIKELLTDKNQDNVLPTMDFLEFIMNNSALIPGTKDDIFVEMIEEDYEIFTILKDLIRSENYIIRKYAMDTTAQLNYEDCLEILNDSFDYYLENDPLNLPELINHIIRMSNEIPQDKISKIINHSNYLVRWSYFKLIQIVNLDYEDLYPALSKLMQDSFVPLKTEALFWNGYFHEIEKSGMIDMTGNTDILIEKGIPDINFETLYTHFYDLLYRKKAVSFTLKELDDFAQYFCFHKSDFIDQYMKK